MKLTLIVLFNIVMVLIYVYLAIYHRWVKGVEYGGDWLPAVLLFVQPMLSMIFFKVLHSYVFI